MAATFFEIPLRAVNQRLSIGLAGVVYSLLVTWRNGWVFDLYTATGAPVLLGVPLVTGADLLAQYEYLNLGGSLYVTTDGDPEAVPTSANLGTNSHLYFGLPA